jgi:hypothetical protein
LSGHEEERSVQGLSGGPWIGEACSEGRSGEILGKSVAKFESRMALGSGIGSASWMPLIVLESSSIVNSLLSRRLESLTPS